MKIAMIAAMGDEREIGYKNQLLWRLPADMRHFRRTTLHKPIIVGRKTYESFGAKPLPDRKNIVITRDRNYNGNGAIVVTSPEEALQAAGDADEVMIIGGATFYDYFLSRADTLYLTYVHGKFKADAWFPEFDPSQWQEVEREDHLADENNPFDYSFVTYQRRC